MHFFDRCPRNVFDVESGFSRKFTTGPEWIFPPYFWKGQHYMAVPTATNCLLFETVLEKKARSGIFFSPLLKKNRSEGGILFYVISRSEHIKLPLWLIPHMVDAPRGMCHWFVHHQWLFLFEDNSTCFHCTWLVLPRHRNQFSLTPVCTSHSKL